MKWRDYLMKTTKPNWNMKKLARMANAGELRFDYPIQRASGQWDALQKSLLIHSIVGDFPIPPVAIAKATVNGQEGEYVIDGKQRSTTVLDFMAGVKDADGNYPANAYPLHAETPEVTIEGSEEVYELQGKYFDQLHEDIQSELLSANFLIQRLEDAPDEVIEEIFNRWNNGTPLTKQQKARGYMGTANATIIDSLLKHSFMQREKLFTPLQRRRADDEAVILQTMMLMSKSDAELTSFVAGDLLTFAQSLRDADITDVTTAVKEALDYIDNVETSTIFKKLHLPTILVMAKKAKDEGISTAMFSAWVEDFKLAIDAKKREKAFVKTGYKKYMGAGSVKKHNVLGRKDEMLKHYNTFIDTYELPEQEVTEEAPQTAPEATEEPTSNVVELPEPMFTDEELEADKKAVASAEPKSIEELTAQQEKEAEDLLNSILG